MIKNKTPLFTVFTRTYNSESVINRVFPSIVEQTFRNFEWIIIDYCSSDETISLVEKFTENLKDSSVVDNPK